MVTYIKLLPEFKLSYGVENGKVEPETGGQMKPGSAGAMMPMGPVVDPKDYVGRDQENRPHRREGRVRRSGDPAIGRKGI